jgi:hypothetical protein
MTEITNAAKLACARREVSMRRRAYPRWVSEGRNGWTQARADAEIAIMEAIAADYEALAKAEAEAIAPKLL